MPDVCVGAAVMRSTTARAFCGSAVLLPNTILMLKQEAAGVLAHCSPACMLYWLAVLHQHAALCACVACAGRGRVPAQCHGQQGGGGRGGAAGSNSRV